MSKEVNLVNSQDDVLTTPTHVLYHFEQMVRKEMPNCNVIYDSELSYESVLASIMNADNYSNEGGTPLPVLGYNRTQLVASEIAGPGRRMRNLIGGLRVGDNMLKYGVSHSEFDIQFVYLTTAVEQADKFEVVYESDEGISGSKELIVNMGALGDFSYFLTFDDLISRDVNLNEQFYKAIMGSIKVRGYYFTFRGTSEIIKEINTKIWASRDISQPFREQLLVNMPIS
ncbi:hypothetical protein KAR91_85990 [Candidatus Pacearchaeota archaeon]|nr:hypothetical protein [Candidatus Pacearchaeota archaeon]